MNSIPKEIEVHLCCNDHRNGNFSGLLSGLSVNFINDESILNLEAGLFLDESGELIEDGLPFEYVGDQRITGIKLMDRQFRVMKYGNWVSNWCWDLITVQVSDAVDILNLLKEDGRFSVTSGRSRVFDAWRAPDVKLTLDMLLEESA